MNCFMIVLWISETYLSLKVWFFSTNSPLDQSAVFKVHNIFLQVCLMHICAHFYHFWSRVQQPCVCSACGITLFCSVWDQCPRSKFNSWVGRVTWGLWRQTLQEHSYHCVTFLSSVCVCEEAYKTGSAGTTVCDGSRCACLHASVSALRKTTVLYKNHLFACGSCLRQERRILENFVGQVSVNDSFYFHFYF